MTQHDSNTLQTLWLYLHFPTLQLDTMALPETEPCAIVDNKHYQLYQLNEAALKAGLKQGMGLASASLMCPELQLFSYSEQQEVKRLEALAQLLYGYYADISLQPPNGLLMKVSSMLSLYQTIEQYWQTLQALLALEQIQYQFAIGYSPLGARLLACKASNSLNDSKKTFQHAISNLTLDELSLSERQYKQLQRIGVKRLSHVLTLSMPELAKRFDLAFVTYLGQLTGQLTSKIAFFHPPSQFSQYLELYYEIKNTDLLLKPLTKLLNQLERFLASRCAGALQLQLALELNEKPTVNMPIAAAQPEYKSHIWFDLIQLKLANLTLKAAVRAIRLTAVEVSEISAIGKDLFDDTPQGLNAAQLVSRLSARLGDSAVCQIALQDEHRPEQGQKLLPANSPIHSQTTAPNYALRPSFLLNQPQTLKQTVSLVNGPERIVTGWWDAEQICRDYFVAINQQGQWLWVFRDALGKWFLHGHFS